MEKGRMKKLIGPMILEQLFAVSVGAVDTFMVARVGEAAVSGVALVDSINLLVIQVMAAFAAGGIVVISQYRGTKNQEMIEKSCSHLEMILGAFSVFIMLIYLLRGKALLQALFGAVKPDVMQAAVTYLTLTGISLVFWSLYSAGSAILRCQENTKTSMKVSLFMNLLNVVLNATFVFGFQMGVLGVALATLISRFCAGIYMKLVTLSSKNEFRIRSLKMYQPSFAMAKNILAMGVPSGIENGMFHVGKIAVARMIATLGTSAIAANAISYQIIEFPNIPGGTFGLALVVIIGADIGAGKKEQAVKDTKQVIKYAYIGDWICKILLFILAPFVVKAFSLSAEATAMAVLVLRCFSIVSLPVWPLSFTLPSALRGAGDVKYSMVVSIIAMWLGRVVLTYILVMHFNLSILGVWIGMFADWFIRGSLYVLRFKSGRWLEKKIV